MTQKNLIVVYAALINVMLVASIPMFFSDTTTTTTITDERHESILRAKMEGLPITVSDALYAGSQRRTARRDGLDRNQKMFIGSPQTIVLISLISIMTLTILAYLNYLRKSAAFMYFLIPSLLIFVFVPAVAGILFLTILFSMIVVYTGQTLLNVINKNT